MQVDDSHEIIWEVSPYFTLIPITGEILRMPGLAKTPAAYRIDIDDNGNISGIG